MIVISLRNIKNRMNIWWYTNVLNTFRFVVLLYPLCPENINVLQASLLPHTF